MLLQVCISGVFSIFFSLLPPTSLFCNVHVSFVSLIFSNAISVLAKSFVHIHMNPSRVQNGLPLQYVWLEIMGPKVDGSSMVAISDKPTSPRIWTTLSTEDGYQFNPNQGCNHFLHKPQALYDYLIHYVSEHSRAY